MTSQRSKPGPDVKANPRGIRLSQDGLKCLQRIQRIMGFTQSVAIEQALRAYALDPNLAEIDRRNKEIGKEESRSSSGADSFKADPQPM